MGEGLTEAEVVRWLVAVGDTVAVDQPVVEVETAKSVVEVPSPFAGTVSELHGEEGEVMAVGGPLISVAGDVPADTARAAAVSPEGERYREEERAGTGSGNVLIGYGTPEAGATGRRRRPRTRPPARGAQPSAPAAPTSAGASAPARGATQAPADSEDRARRVPLVTSPLVRQMAREAGLRIADVPGSGPGGLITRRDVRAAVEAARADTATDTTGTTEVTGTGARREDAGATATTGAIGAIGSAGATGSAATTGSAGATGSAATTGAIGSAGTTGAIGSAGAAGAIGSAGAAGAAGSAGATGSAATRATEAGETAATTGARDPRTGLTESRRVPMSGFRRSVAASLSRSRREIPEATVWVDVDATDLVRLRRSDPEGPGLLAYVARFVVAGLRAHPELNGLVDTERGELVQYDGINLGLAVQTDRGLVAPAVMGAHGLTTRALDARIRELTRQAREGTVPPAHMNAGTFTLNNYGSLRVDGSAAIINHPQVAILGLGRILDRPWIVDGEVVARKITQLSFAFDHRVCDGGAAAGFMRVVADAMENPAAAIADL
ncbi:branched-chain alpha-keto acid dehydrogenase subunit E2 [Nocardiopsis sp. NRRL B-16309]|nr:branched-chain alpha-keto acid dehydrogenase subunit E2 [Nocardiopsis sp. NRRL B-16309]